MEKPDEKGFVSISWPSKNIPYGGIFHTKVPEASKAQQEFLKVLLEESKLSIAQRRKGAYTLRQEDAKPESRQTHIPLVRPRTSRRRSLSAIRESGALEVEHYRPAKRGEDREKLIESFANNMAYGDKEQRPPPQPRLNKPKTKLPTKKEQWNDLVTQIRERADWLAEMEYLGHAAPHRELVEDQIAERLRALDALGVDSRISSARSTASGFSVVPTPKEHSARSKESVKTRYSNQSASTRSKKLVLESTKKLTKEENIMAYEKILPLKYSPRRRV